MTDFIKMTIRSNYLTRFVRNNKIELWLDKSIESRALEYQINSTWGKRL